MTRTARFPFSFRQRVKHETLGNDFIVLAMEADHTGQWTVSVTDSRGGGFWRFPAHELTYAELADEQQSMAEWMGCNVARMNRHHDQIHAWLAERAGIPSYSLKLSAGGKLTPEEHAIAAAEEDAVLYLQRLLCTIENMAMKRIDA